MVGDHQTPATSFKGLNKQSREASLDNAWRWAWTDSCQDPVATSDPCHAKVSISWQRALGLTLACSVGTQKQQAMTFCDHTNGQARGKPKGNIWSICLQVRIFSHSAYVVVQRLSALLPDFHAEPKKPTCYNQNLGSMSIGGKSSVRE